MDNKKTEVRTFNGEVTQAQIDAWKGKHRKVVEITVTDEDEVHVGYFRRPDMATMSAVNTLAKTDEVKSSNTMFDNCWLGGSPFLKEDAILRMAAIGQLATVLNSCIGSIKNL